MRPDVLIVGFGPAGASAAAAAAAAGCDVLAVERRGVIGTPVQCAEFVSAVLSLPAVSWDAVSTQSILRMLTMVEAEAPEERDDFRGRMISRLQFDQALARYALARGARCLTGTTVTKIRPDGGVGLSNGVEFRPRVIVGADGPRSRVGAAIGRTNSEFVATRQVTLPMMRPHDATDIFLRAAYRGGYGWLFPKGGSAHLGIGVDHACRDRLKPLLRELHVELAATGRVATGAGTHLTGGLIPVGGRLHSIGALGQTCVLLAGDAAGLTNPVTGAGIEAAVRSGALAGAAAAQVIAGCADVLEDYEEEMSSLFDTAYGRALRRRRAVIEAFATGGPGAAALRRAWISSPDYWRVAAS